VEERAVSKAIAERWAKANNNMPYFETSAKDGINVEEVSSVVMEKKKNTE